jgi:hypothetical protein
MTRFSDHMNMSEDDSYESESDYGGYSDTDLRDEGLGDRYAEEDYKQTEAEQLEDENDQDDDERKYKNSLLQHPDTMELILTPRVMPSVNEMNECFDDIINTEYTAKAHAWAVPIIENFVRYYLDKKKAKRDQLTVERKRKELVSWKAARNGRHGIRQLGPVIIFEVEYQLMADAKLKHSLIKTGIESRVQSIAAKAQAAIDSDNAVIRYRKAGKARALAKEGMNKKTAWHKARVANSLDIATKKVVSSDAGNGKRANRRLRQDKERREAIARAIRLPEEKKTAFVFVDTDDERTDEQKEIEKEEMDEDLRLLSRVCIEKAEKRDAIEAAENAEAKASADLKANDEAELAEFVTMMTKNKKPKKIVIDVCFKSLKEQTIDRRKATDKKFSARCDGFEDLGSKEKLAHVLKFTSLCRSVGTKKKCYHKDCRFAHSIEQLQQKDCRFGLGCCFVKQMPNGQYENTKVGRTCACMHIGEHKRGFCSRMGLKYVETGEKVQKVQEVVEKKVITSASASAPAPSVWANVVSKSDIVTAECKLKMTKSWSAVVVETLTEDEKIEIYGKGVELLGSVSEDREALLPIIPITNRKSWDKRGLGFDKPIQKICTKVLQSGFNWVKGAVLVPHLDMTPALDPVMAKVMTAVQVINERVAKIAAQQLIDERVVAVLDPVMVKVMTAVKVINERVAKIAAQQLIEERVVAAVKVINERVEKIELDDLERRVYKAKAKAAEITKRLVTAEKKTWTKVKGRGSTRQVTENRETEAVTVFRVPRADAELALLGAIRNGLTNFRIEYTDETSYEKVSRRERGRGVR